MEVLRPGDFYQGAHRILYEAMVDLYDRGRPIDQLTLSAVLKDRNAEQQVGGLAYLSEIVTSVPISDNVVHYARIVKEKSILRKTISAAQEISAAAFQGSPTSTSSSTGPSRRSSPSPRRRSGPPTTRWARWPARR